MSSVLATPPCRASAVRMNRSRGDRTRRTLRGLAAGLVGAVLATGSTTGCAVADAAHATAGRTHEVQSARRSATWDPDLARLLDPTRRSVAMDSSAPAIFGDLNRQMAADAERHARG